MPWAVAFIGILCFLAGIATTAERWVTAGFLITAATAFALWLRHRVKFRLREEFEKGAGYITNTRRQIRKVDELEVSNVPNAAKKWLKDKS